MKWPPHELALNFSGGKKLNTITLEKIGFTEQLKQEALQYEHLYAARISSQHKDLYKVISENGELEAKVSGKMSFNAYDVADYPAVGDWVMIDRTSDENGIAIIHQLLTRKSMFERKAAGTANNRQIVAANIDIVFICMALNNDFNLRRLERYLAIAWDSLAIPVVVLTKADLCENLEQKLAEVSSVAIGIDVIPISFLTDDGLTQIKGLIDDGITAACIGSSGVGKSTLINRLIGYEVLQTSDIRDDDKGRHTTTHRQLLILPDSGVIIDTPGMRELQIGGADLSSSFSDIEEFATQCRFNDCMHNTEPNCAVKEAITNGQLTQERLQSYRKLQRELTYQDLKAEQREKQKINNMFGSLSAMKQISKQIKRKNHKK